MGTRRVRFLSALACSALLTLGAATPALAAPSPRAGCGALASDFFGTYEVEELNDLRFTFEPDGHTMTVRLLGEVVTGSYTAGDGKVSVESGGETAHSTAIACCPDNPGTVAWIKADYGGGDTAVLKRQW
jgi:hypothetical protein